MRELLIDEKNLHYYFVNLQVHVMMRNIVSWIAAHAKLPRWGSCMVKRGLADLLWIIWRLGWNEFSFDRGVMRTSGRYYIEQFLKRYAAECRGRFLEFGESFYKGQFNSAVIEGYDTIDVVDRPGLTIRADIQHCPEIPSNTYDVIVCTQVLEHVANPFDAIAEIHRILKPGGRLMLTVPAAYPYHGGPHDYWRYTKDSLKMLFSRFSEVRIHSYGNRLVVVAAYWYWMIDDLRMKVLNEPDPDNATILAVYACK